MNAGKMFLTVLFDDAGLTEVSALAITPDGGEVYPEEAHAGVCDEWIVRDSTTEDLLARAVELAASTPTDPKLICDSSNPSADSGSYTDAQGFTRRVFEVRFPVIGYEGVRP